jgi:hypothetical protein
MPLFIALLYIYYKLEEAEGEGGQAWKALGLTIYLYTLW